jgi:hypothetical protein
MVSELFRQQKELTSILAAKDKEIDDYKSQGVRTSRSEYDFYCKIFVFFLCFVCGFSFFFSFFLDC